MLIWSAQVIYLNADDMKSGSKESLDPSISILMNELRILNHCCNFFCFLPTEDTDMVANSKLNQLAFLMFVI